jgi:hypothetical protein
MDLRVAKMKTFWQIRAGPYDNVPDAGADIEKSRVHWGGNSLEWLL